MFCSVYFFRDSEGCVAPILLDNRGLVKAGAGLVLVLLLVFASGFIAGYHKATAQQLAENEAHGMELPETQSHSTEALDVVLAPQIPEHDAPGADIDVDGPDIEVHVSSVSESENTELAVLTGQAKPGSSRVSIVNPNKSQPSDTEDTEREVATREPDHTGAADPDETAVDVVTTSKHGRDGTNESGYDEVEKHEARYSIQVGMYGQRVNAENLVKMLAAQGLNAYSSEYLNKKQQLRYNVRFGFFADKKSALAALRQYRDTLDGKGYLIRLKQPIQAAENTTGISSGLN